MRDTVCVVRCTVAYYVRKDAIMLMVQDDTVHLVQLRSLTLGAHAPEGLRYLSCLFVCLSVRLLPLNRGHRSFLRST